MTNTQTKQNNNQNAIKDSLRLLEIASGNQPKRKPSFKDYLGYTYDKAALDKEPLTPEEYERKLAEIIKKRRI